MLKLKINVVKESGILSLRGGVPFSMPAKALNEVWPQLDYLCGSPMYSEVSLRE